MECNVGKVFFVACIRTIGSFLLFYFHLSYIDAVKYIYFANFDGKQKAHRLAKKSHLCKQFIMKKNLYTYTILRVFLQAHVKFERIIISKYKTENWHFKGTYIFTMPLTRRSHNEVQISLHMFLNAFFLLRFLRSTSSCYVE